MLWTLHSFTIIFSTYNILYLFNSLLVLGNTHLKVIRKYDENVSSRHETNKTDLLNEHLHTKLVSVLCATESFENCVDLNHLEIRFMSVVFG